MPTEREHFGAYLRKQRESRGLSLTDVSRATKIKESKLMALEAAQVESLPARVFVVGYVGAYARAIGCDPTEALARLSTHAAVPTVVRIGQDVKKVVERAPADEAAPPKARKRSSLVLLVFLLLALIVIAITVGVLLRYLNGRVFPGSVPPPTSSPRVEPR
jgi:cytoskeletal protein RodZ